MDHDPAPPPWAEAGAYATLADASDHGLVVLAMGLSYWLVETEARFRLLVEPGVIDAVREQLACFDRESVGWPPIAPIDRARRLRLPLVTPLLWALVTIAIFRGQQQAGGTWEERGALEAQAIFERGEWWRPATALFLHADVGHLTANVLSGIFVFAAALSACGVRRGWTLIGVAAYGGNVAAAALRLGASETWQSLGASTAIFAGIGVLTGRAVRRALRAPRVLRGRAVLAPLGGGIVLLGFLGAGGVRTDLLAHATGFFAGMILGFVAGAREDGATRAPRAG